MRTRVPRPIFPCLALIGLGLIAGTAAEAQEELAVDGGLRQPASLVPRASA